MIPDPRSSLEALAQTWDEEAVEYEQEAREGPPEFQSLQATRAYDLRQCARDLRKLDAALAAPLAPTPDVVNTAIRYLLTKGFKGTWARVTFWDDDGSRHEFSREELEVALAPARPQELDTGAGVRSEPPESQPTLQQAFDTLPKAWEPAGTLQEARLGCGFDRIEAMSISPGACAARLYQTLHKIIQIDQSDADCVTAMEDALDVYLRTSPSTGEARLRELARQRAKQLHEAAYDLCGSRVFAATGHDGPGGFDTCSEPSCVLVRAGLVPEQEKPCGCS